ncbi:MAG: molybdopterin-dependent oxidoreductase, partial [Chloroflexi bacterium]|nr:molybdopterin-dependent oxidoreductase [Chloroflexota bacterium]
TVLVFGSNPMYELPAALGFEAALSRGAYLITFSAFPDETAQLSDMVLPVRLPLEDWGDVPTETPPAVTIRQPFLQPLYGSQSFWDILLTLGRELGISGWPGGSFEDVVREAAMHLPGIDGADPARAWTELRAKGFWQAQPTQRKLALAPNANPARWQPAQFAGDPSAYPYFLHVFEHNSLDAGSGANLPWMQALPDPITSVVWETWVEVSPKHGFAEGDILRVQTPQGAAELPAYVNPAAPPDVISIPLGQGHKAYGRYAQGRGINALDLLTPLRDGTGGLAYSATRARVVPTGRNIKLSKFEGDVLAYQIPGKEVLEVQYGAK